MDDEKGPTMPYLGEWECAHVGRSTATQRGPGAQRSMEIGSRKSLSWLMWDDEGHG